MKMRALGWGIAVTGVAAVLAAAAMAQYQPRPGYPPGQNPRPPDPWARPRTPGVPPSTAPSRPPANSRGPWQNDLAIRRSPDGRSFGAAEVLVPSAGVPSAIRDARGRIWLAFQWFPQEKELAASFDRVAVIGSDDGGKTWSRPRPIVVEGYPDGFQRPFDPTLALTEDGTIRVYFSGGPRPREGQPGRMDNVATHSAYSRDGVHFTYDTGVRFAVGGRSVIDPAVLRLGETWHLIAPAGRPQDGAFHAVSVDGLRFTRVGDIASVAGENWTGNLLTVLGGMRFYGGGERGVWWSFSSDGISWSSPRTTTIPNGGDPTVVINGEGEYLVVYVARSPEAERRTTNFPTP